MTSRLSIASVCALILIGFSPSVARASHCQNPAAAGISSTEYFEGRSSDQYYCERHGFLGPVGWWWNLIRYDFLGDNTVALWLFGWEIFLLGVGLVLSAVIWTVSTFTAGLQSSRK